MLQFLGEIIVNGSPAELGADKAIPTSEIAPIVPAVSEMKGTNNKSFSDRGSLYSIYKKDRAKYLPESKETVSVLKFAVKSKN